jgi:diguanylate cyclase (GGDEF)-like protein/PAS domain S-box-containing protein
VGAALSATAHRLPHRRVVMFVIALALATIAALAWKVIDDKQKEFAIFRSELQLQSQALGSGLETSFDSVEQMMSGLVHQIDSGVGPIEDLDLRGLLLRSPALLDLKFYGADARLVVQASLLPTTSPVLPDWVAVDAARGRVTGFGRTGEEFEIYRVIRGTNGDLSGTVVATISKAYFRGIADQVPGSAPFASFLIGPDNRLVLDLGDTAARADLNKALQLVDQVGQGFDSHGSRFIEIGSSLIAIQQLRIHPLRLIQAVSKDVALARWNAEVVQSAVMASVIALAALMFVLYWLRSARVHQGLMSDLHRMNMAIEQTPASVVITDPQGGIQYVNPRFTEVTGYSTAEVLGQNPRMLHSGRTAEADYRDLWGKLTSGQVWHGELMNKRKNGELYWEDASIAPVKDAAGRVTHYVGVKIDITERKRAEGAINELNRNFVSFLENTSDFIYFKDENSRFRFCSQTLATITGHASWRDMVGKHDLEVFPPETAQLYQEEEAPIFSQGTPLLNKVNPYFDAAGNKGWVSTNKWPLLDQDGKVVGLFGISRDITEHKRLEDQVRQLAFYDPLTRLPNRRLLNDRLSQTMAANKRSANYGAMNFLDLDNFKSLNDTHGHDAGDLLLIEVARRLTACVREVDTVARFGGDEFVVLLSDLSSDRAEARANAELVAEKIRSALSEPYFVTLAHEGQVQKTVEHHCTASIGVALFNHEASPNDILKWADDAMYEAKGAGRNSVRFHTLKACVPV